MSELALRGAEVVPTSSPLADVQLRLVNSVDEAYAFKRWLGERRDALGVDTESGGLKPERHRLRLVQFGDLQTGWAIPWELWGGVALEALNAYDEQLVMHHSSHDCRFLQTHAGWRPRWSKIDDTLTMAHLVDPGRPKGLKPLADRLVDPRATAGQKMLDQTMTKHGWTWDTIPTDHPHYWVYGALDPVLTCHIRTHLKPVMDQRGYGRAYDLEMNTVRICAEMMLRGIRIDLDYCESKATELRAWVLTARDWIRREYGIDNATSNAQVIRRLQADGVELTKRTKGGAIALDKEVLEYVATLGHPLARYILAIRRAEKICGSYLENFSEMVGPDGRIHASINTLAAITSRMSITEPGLQTLHRDDPTVRDAFVATRGRKLLACDADQIEARLATHFSGDPGLRAAFLAEGDFFCEVASQIFNEPISRGDQRRQITKNTVYGKIYGAGVETIAHTAHVTPQVAQVFVSAFDARFPGIAQLMERTMAEARARLEAEGRAYVTTPFGREIPVDGRNAREYALVNYQIQGHAAEILKQGLADLDAAGLGDYLVLPVHDEVIMDVPEAEVEEARRTVERVLTDLTTYAVPLTWSADVYPERWGDKIRMKAA